MSRLVLKILPNLITISRMFAGPVGAYCLLLSASADLNSDANAWGAISFALLVYGAISDGLDGWVARALNAESALGTLLDPIADKILTGTYLGAFLVISEFDVWLAVPIVGIIVRDVVVTALRLFRPHTTALTVSAEAKFKTAALMVLIMMPFVFYIAGLRDIADWYFFWVGGIWFIASLSAWTALAYLRKRKA